MSGGAFDSPTLHGLEAVSSSMADAVPLNDRDKYRWYAWTIKTQRALPDTMPTTGRVRARSSDRAMVLVRDAALATGVARPFTVRISRVFIVEDEIVQRTKEATS